MQRFDTSFDTGIISLAGYFTGQLAGTMTLEIENIEGTHADLKVTVTNTGQVPQKGSTAGAGFWNGLSWGFADDPTVKLDASQIPDPNPSDPGGDKPQRVSSLPGYEAGTDIRSNCNTQLDQLLGKVSPNKGIYVHEVCRVIGQDNNEDPVETIGGPWQKTSGPYVWEDVEIFNADGSLKTLYPVYVASRYYYNDNNTPGLDESLFHANAEYVSLPGFTTGMDWSYFPWAVKSGNLWLSTNRKAHGYSVRENDSWRDAKNDLYGDIQHGYIKVNGIWQRQPITGTE